MPILSRLYGWIFLKIRGKGVGLGFFNRLHALLWERFLEPDQVKILGMRLHLPRYGRDMAETLKLGQVWEPEVVKALQQRLGPGMAFVDIGANLGYYSVLASRLVGSSGQVLAFEPELENLHLLVRNLQENGCANVEIFPYAVGSKLAYAGLHLCSWSSGGHSLALERVEGGTTKRVVSVALDEFFGAEVRIDAIKMDIEGGEWNALQGMPRILRDPRLKTLIVECHPEFLDSLGLKPESVLSFLREIGFRMEQLDSLNYLGARR